MAIIEGKKWSTTQLYFPQNMRYGQDFLMAKSLDEDDNPVVRIIRFK